MLKLYKTIMIIFFGFNMLTLPNSDAHLMFDMNNLYNELMSEDKNFRSMSNSMSKFNDKYKLIKMSIDEALGNVDFINLLNKILQTTKVNIISTTNTYISFSDYKFLTVDGNKMVIEGKNVSDEETEKCRAVADECMKQYLGLGLVDVSHPENAHESILTINFNIILKHVPTFVILPDDLNGNNKSNYWAYLK